MPAESKPPQLEFDSEIFSVTEITRRINAALNREFSIPFWVRGEVSNYKGRNQKGHLYFSLKDEEALLPCVFFARQNAKLEIDLSEGMDILALGTLNVYAPHGRYQLVIQRLLPGGMGQLYLKFEKLKKQLTAEGFFEAERKKPLVRYPHTIGIITSPTGAVIRDFLKIINRRYPMVKVILVPTPVQGDAAAPAIAQSIALLNQYSMTSTKIDTIVLARGGGSIEDLWPFNEEVVARAIFASKIPIVSAIGHETDFTISDFVADVRAATPTHAAELVVPDHQELLRELEHITKRMFQTVKQEVDIQGQRLKRCTSANVLRFPEKIIVDARQTIDRHLERMGHRLELLLQDKQLHLMRPSERLITLNPLKVLERGFALAENASGQAIRHSDDVKVGAPIRVRLFRGALDATVSKVLEEGEK
jgi:exodeoxyribonuclease VII large subunit